MKLEMKGIYKSFGANDVLKNVDFSLAEGEICALLGENGAGKSTLMNILGGVLRPDQGEILLDGQKQAFRTPAQSLDAGIAFIHQELNLINDLPVYENMFIGRELKKKSGFVDHRRMVEQTRRVFERMAFDLDPQTPVRRLDASYKQIVEISRALMMNARIIIMDEPTTSLTEPEIERVFAILRTLKAQGVGIIFISHKLREVMELCDRYTVLRDGVMVADGFTKDVTPADIARSMVGHDVGGSEQIAPLERGKEMLRLQNVTAKPYFQDISLTAYAGEVLGVTGLLGDGRSELFSSVFGAGAAVTGSVYMEGKPLHILSPEQAIRSGLAYVPRNRKENGIIKDMSILANGTVVSWKRLSRRGFIKHRQLSGAFDEKRRSMHIKMGRPADGITSLSGGNQQKVVLAKWLMEDPRVLILDNPTQGVDVGAKEDIYGMIRKLAGHGVAVIVLSSEAQEIIRLCDRTLVMYHGRMMGELNRSQMNEHDIMRLATGG